MAALVLVAGSAGCRGSAVPQPPGSTKVSLSDFAFSPNSLAGKPGENVFYLVNVGKQSHDMAVVAADGKQVAKSDLVSPGDATVFKVNLGAPGAYRIICTQPGHEDAGMKGALTIS